MDRQYLRNLFVVVTDPIGNRLGKKCPTGIENLYYFVDHREFLEFEGQIVRPRAGALLSLLVKVAESPSRPEDLEKIRFLTEERDKLLSSERKVETLSKINLRNLSNFSRSLIEFILLRELGYTEKSSGTILRKLLKEYEVPFPENVSTP